MPVAYNPFWTNTPNNIPITPLIEFVRLFYYTDNLKGIQFCIHKFPEIKHEIKHLGNFPQIEEFIDDLSEAIHDDEFVQDYLISEIAKLDYSKPEGKNLLAFLAIFEKLPSKLIENLAVKLDDIKIDASLIAKDAEKLDALMEILLSPTFLENDYRDDNINDILKKISHTISKNLNASYLGIFDPQIIHRLQLLNDKTFYYHYDLSHIYITDENLQCNLSTIGENKKGNLFDIKIFKNNLARKWTTLFLKELNLPLAQDGEIALQRLFIYTTAAAYIGELIIPTRLWLPKGKTEDIDKIVTRQLLTFKETLVVNDETKTIWEIPIWKVVNKAFRENHSYSTTIHSIYERFNIFDTQTVPIKVNRWFSYSMDSTLSYTRCLPKD
jgi:hypothetical protein